jgi:hypothetical protein
MADLTIPQNDKGYYQTFTINNSAGVAYNLTGYIIKLKVWKANKKDTLIVNGTCEPINEALGTCKYLVTVNDFIIKEIYQAELELTKSGIIESTESFTIEVKESG